MKMKFYNIYFKRFLSLLLLTAAAVNCIFGQDEIKNPPSTIGGHKFIHNSTLGTSFLNTYYNNLLGAGTTSGLELPPVQFNGRTIFQLQGEMAFTTLGLEYQQEIRDWLAFFGKVKLTGRLGTETGALISQGFNLATGYNIGWKFKVYNNEKMNLSTYLSLSNSSYTTFNFSRFVQGIIDSGRITKDNKLVQNVPLVRGGIGANYDYVLNKTFGLQAKFYVDYGESAIRGESDVLNYNYGLGIDADLIPGLNIPLGFLAGFYHTSIPQYREKPSRDPNEILFQINYIGKSFLNVGTEINYQWYKPEGFESSVQFMTLNLNTTIYF